MSQTHMPLLPHTYIDKIIDMGTLIICGKTSNKIMHTLSHSPYPIARAVLTITRGAYLQIDDLRDTLAFLFMT